MAVIDISRSDVQTDIKDSVKFSVSASAASKIAQMLGNFLYSDKEYAVVSELCANAYDIHRLVDKNEPIHVQLPTRVEPEFVVRDFGTGMKEADVVKYLTTYGESSKSETNDQIGFWGIGSKSPAAVSDTWSIISYHAGKKSHYEVFIDSDGVPSLKKMFEIDSDETGLEVRVPVSKDNFHTWNKAAEKAFKYYDVKPKVNASIYYPKLEYTVKNDKFGIKKSSDCNIITTMREYRIDLNKIIQYTDNQFVKAFLNDVSNSYNSRFDLFFNIGEIDLSISREQIQYNQKTINAIVARVEEIVEHIKNEVATRITNIVSGIDYRVKLQKVFSDYHYQSLLNMIISGNSYGVNNVSHDLKTIKFEVNYSDLNYQVVYRGQRKAVSRNFNAWKTYAMTTSTNYDHQSGKSKHSISISVNDYDKFVFVNNDVRGAVNRVKHSFNDDKFYVIGTKNFFDKITKVINASDLEKVPSTASVRGNYIKTDFYVLNSNNRFNKIQQDDISVDSSVFVKIENAKQGNTLGIGSGDKYSFLKSYGYSIIGYKGEKIGKDADETILELYNKYVNNSNVVEYIAKRKLTSRINTCAGSSVLTMLVLNDIQDDTWQYCRSKMTDIIDHYASTGNMFVNRLYQLNEVNIFMGVCEFLGKKVFEVESLDDVEKTCVSKYPMLKYVCVRNDDFSDAIRNYVSLVNKGV